MKKLITLLAAALAAGYSLLLLRADPAFDLSAVSYTSSAQIKEPWCGGFLLNPPSSYADHLLTTTTSWSYNLPLNLPVNVTINDEWYHYDSYVSHILVFYSYQKNVWQYPTYLQLPAQAVHTYTDNTGANIVDNNSSQKVFPTTRQADVYGNYPAQGCSFYGTTTSTVNGRQYFSLTNGGTNVYWRATLHLETSVDQVTGFHYAPHFYRIRTFDGSGFKGALSPAFNDTTGNAVITIAGGTLYDVTPTYYTSPGHYDYTYVITFVSAVIK